MNQSSEEILSQVPPTELHNFDCQINPQFMMRQKNLKDGMIWLAVYDEDILSSNIKQKIAYCTDNRLP